MTDFDDQLRGELDRRSASVETGRDWARHELLPGVLDGIDSRPQRLATSRAPAFVGLAAAAAIIVILVVAMPRLGIGPAATDSTSLAPPTTPPTREIACDASHPMDAIGLPVITDETGQIVSCSVSQAAADLGEVVRVRNPDGDLGQLEIMWAGTPCDVASTFTFFPIPEGYALNGQRPDADCDTSRVAYSMMVQLSGEVDAASVTALLVDPGPFPTPTPATRDIPCSSDPISAVTITDETGLIALCEDAATPSDGEAALNVENPDGDVYVLRITWAGVCSPSGRFTLRPSGDHFELVVFVPPSNVICDGLPMSHDVLVYLDEPIPTASLQTTFVETPEETPPPLTPASWELAPSERPTATSDRFSLIVHDPGCLQEPARPGRLLDPEITYDESTVTITFFVDSGAGIPRCPASGSYPSDVFLNEPLGDRQLVDGGSEDGYRVLTHEDGLLLVQAQDAYPAATDRFGWLIGDDACPDNDENLPAIDEAALTELANALAAGEGMLGDRLAWLGESEDAVRELGGFELYRDREGKWMILALDEGQEWLSPLGKPGDLVLADLTSIPISGDRTIWVPGTWFQGFASPDCDSPDDGTGQVQASEEALDFTLSISASRVDNIARQPIEGLQGTLEYTGSDDPIHLSGSGTGLAFMMFEQIDGGPGLPFGVTSDCRPYEVVPGEVQQLDLLPSNFSGGGSARLPVGIYRLSAVAGFVIGDECTGPGVDLNASTFVRVR